MMILKGLFNSFLRAIKNFNAVILIGTALSNTVDFRRMTMGVIHVPAGWTAASIGFQVSTNPDGPFTIFNQEDGTLEEVAAVAGESFNLPPRLAGVHYFQIWSQTAGVAVNQVVERNVLIDMKS